DRVPLVIVRQDGRPTLCLQVPDFFNQVRRISVTRTTLPLVAVPPLRGRLGNASVHRRWWTALSGGREPPCATRTLNGGNPMRDPPLQSLLRRHLFRLPLLPREQADRLEPLLRQG